MISDETRKLAEETFDRIERSEASGNSYEANLPIGWEPLPCYDRGLLGDVSMALAEHTASAIDKILGA